MGTRRWIKNLAKWVALSGLSTEAVAKRSRHKTAHVLELFADPNPNPSLRLYLDLASVAGARLGAVQDNTPAAVVAHLAALARDNGITLSALARSSGVSRPQLSTLFNDTDPNPTLVTIDRLVTALGVAPDFGLVRVDLEAADDDEGDAEADDDEDEDDDEQVEADDDDDDQVEADADDDDDDQADADDDDEQVEADDDDDDQVEADDDENEDDDQVEADDTADEAAEREAVIGALQQQTTQLQRRLQSNEAEIAQLKEGRMSKFAKGMAMVGSGLLGAGIAIFVLKPPPKT